MLTDFVEQQDDLLVGVGSAHKLLHFEAPVGERVARIQYLQNDVRRLHHLHEVLVEGPPRPLCTGLQPRQLAPLGIAAQLLLRIVAQQKGCQGNKVQSW